MPEWSTDAARAMPVLHAQMRSEPAPQIQSPRMMPA